jgi:hypothetical protein
VSKGDLVRLCRWIGIGEEDEGSGLGKCRVLGVGGSDGYLSFGKEPGWVPAFLLFQWQTAR